MRRKFDGFAWEYLGFGTKRAKVIGGWLVLHDTNTTKGALSESMTFVPDKDHEWLILEPVQPTVSNDPVIPY